jgi:hypothetical protein
MTVICDALTQSQGRLISYIDGPYRLNTGATRKCQAHLSLNGYWDGQRLFIGPELPGYIYGEVTSLGYNDLLWQEYHVWRLALQIQDKTGVKSYVCVPAENIIINKQTKSLKLELLQDSRVLVEISRSHEFRGLSPHSEKPPQSCLQELVNVTWDGTAPEIGLPACPALVSRGHCLGVSFSDGGSGLREWSLREGESVIAGGKEAQAILDWQGLGAGAHSLVLSAVDNANNIAERPIEFSLDLDDPSIILPGLPSTSGPLLDISYSISDPSSGIASWSINLDKTILASGNAAVASGRLKTFIPDGSHTLTFKALDRAGNAAVKEFSTVTSGGAPLISPASGSFSYAVRTPAISFAIKANPVTQAAIASWKISEDGKILASGSAEAGAGRIAPSLTDGRHTLKVEAKDALGNQASAEWKVLVDTLAPQAVLVDLKAGNSSIPAHGRSPARILRAIMAPDPSGDAVAWSWCALPSRSAAPSFPAANTVRQPAFDIDLGPSDKESEAWIYIRAIDALGNASPAIERFVRRDPSPPSPPCIRLRASGGDSAIFCLSPGGAEGSSGVAELQSSLWLVTKGGQATMVSGWSSSPPSSEGARLEFTGLSGPSEASFQLRSTALGLNGLRSAEAIISFTLPEASGWPRADSGIPRLIPDQGSGSWTSSPFMRAIWVEGSGLNSIRARAYTLNADPNWRPPLDEAGLPRTGIPAGWTPISQNGLEFNAAGLGALGGQGRLLLYLEDQGGQARFGEAAIALDALGPAFPAGQSAPLTLAWDEGQPARLKASWAAAADSASGVQGYCLSLEAPDPSGGALKVLETLWLPAGARQGHFGLHAAQGPLYARLTARDAAGNRTEAGAWALRGDAKAPAARSEAFLQDVGSYRLEGVRQTGTDGAWSLVGPVILALPSWISLEAASTQGSTPIRRLLLPRKVSMAGPLPAQAWSDPGNYRLGCGGFSLKASSLVFKTDRGLELDGCLYERPGGGPALALPGLVIGPAPGTLPRMDAAAVLPEGFKLLFSPWGAGSTQSPLALLGARGLRLEGGYEHWSGDELRLDLSRLVPMGMELVREGRQDWAGCLPLSSLSTRPDSTSPHGQVDCKGLTLRMGGLTYELKKAAIQDTWLIVSSASLRTSDDRILARLGGFRIDLALARAEAIPGGYRAISESLVDSQGRPFAPGSLGLELGPDGSLSASGDLEWDSRRIAFSSVPLGQTGLLWRDDAYLPEVNFVLHGFPVKSSKARIEDGGILMEEAWIRFLGAERPLAGLTVAWEGDGPVVAHPGHGPGAPLRAVGIGGLACTINAYSLEREGLFLDASLELPPSLFPPASGTNAPRTLRFTRLGLDCHGDIQGGASSASFEAVLHGFKGRMEGLNLLNGALALGVFTISPPGGSVPPSLAFSGMKLDAGRDLGPAAAKAPFSLERGGWSLACSEAVMEKGAIRLKASLRLPEALGGGEVSFPQARLDPAGNFYSGQSAGGAQIRLVGWPAYLEGLSLVARAEGRIILRAAKASLDMEAYEGGILEIGDIELDPQGKIVSVNGAASGPARLLSANGYLLEPASFVLDGDGLRASGGISCALWRSASLEDSGQGPCSTFTNPCLRLGSDGIAFCTERAETVSMRTGGFLLTARGLDYGASFLSVKRAALVWKDSRIELGEGLFATDGTVVSALCSDQRVPLELNGTRVVGLGFALREEGLETSALLRLPAAWGGASAYLERLRLEAGGSFDCECLVERLAFASGGFGFLLEDLRLARGGMAAGSLRIALPQACRGAEIALRDINVTPEGDFSLGGASADPLLLWGLGVDIAGLEYRGGELRLSGAVSLPEGLPGQLGGKRVGLKELRLSSSGELLALDFNVQGSFRVSIAPGWAVILKDPGAACAGGRPRLRVAKAALAFPPDFHVREAYVEDFSLDLETGAPAFGRAGAEGELPMQWGNLSLSLTGISFTPEMAVSLSGTARLLPGTGVPECLEWRPDKPTRLEIDRFRIGPDGRVESFRLAAQGLAGPLAGCLDLKAGSASVELEGPSQGGKLIARASGALVFNQTAPEGMAGHGLALEAFACDLSTGRILDLRASGGPMNFHISEYDIEDARLGLTWDAAAQSGTVSASGNLVLPESLPGPLAGARAGLTSLVIGTDGSLRSLAAEFSTAKGLAFPAFGAILMRDATLRAGWRQGLPRPGFSLAATLILPKDSFPGCLGGLELTVSEAAFTAAGSLESFSAEAAIPDGTELLGLRSKGLVLGASASGGADPVFSLRGRLSLPAELPETLPRKLRSLEAVIEDIRVDSRGRVLAFKAGAGSIDLDLWEGALGLRDCALALLLPQGGQEILLGLSGQAILIDPDLPVGLRGTRLRLDSLIVSPSRGILDVSAALLSQPSFEILPNSGLVATISMVELSQAGIGLGAWLRLPGNYPKGLAGMRIDLDSLRFDWKGRVTELRGGLGELGFTLGGLDASVKGLYLGRDDQGRWSLSLRSCVLGLPACLGGENGSSVKIENAAIDLSSGKVSGQVAGGSLGIEAAGFALVLENLGIEAERIRAGKATLKAPPFLGEARISLSGLSVSRSGLEMEGGAFNLPDFEVPGGPRFKNVSARLDMGGQDGHGFMVSAKGCACIPGLGTLGAELAFTEKSTTYPIGLKRAFLEYYAPGPGLPLGASGLYLNGIRGGLAYGPPDELPETLQGDFPPQGLRLQLGARLVDRANGELLTADGDIWMDVANMAVALQADAVLFRGKLGIAATVLASLNAKNGLLHAGMDVSLSIIRGKAEFWIFREGQATVFSGTAGIELKLERGRIFSSRWLSIPSREIWLGGLSAEFGSFREGDQRITGFKAFVNLPILGQVGAFIGDSRGLVLGKVSQLVLNKPRPSAAAHAMPPHPSAGISSRDFRDLSEKDGEYSFEVPHARAASASGRPSAAVRPSMAFDGQAPASREESGLERIVFAMGYGEGDPEIVAVSPSGIEYRPGDPWTETYYLEGGLCMVVLSPEAGAWKARVTGAADPAFELAVLAKEGEARIGLDCLEEENTPAAESFRVKGWAQNGSGRVLASLVQAGGSAAGLPAGEGMTAADGSFSFDIDLSAFPEGEYGLYVELAGDADQAWPRAYAAGSLHLRRPERLPAAPASLLAAEIEPGTVLLSWSAAPGERPTGYILEETSDPSGAIQRFDAGLLKSMSISGYPAGRTLSFRLLAYDAAGREGTPTPWTDVVIGGNGQPGGRINAPRLRQDRLALAAEIGSRAEVRLIVDLEGYAPAEGAPGSLRLEIDQTHPALELDFEELRRVDAPSLELAIGLRLPESIAPGKYSILGRLANLADRSLEAPFEITLEAAYPRLHLDSVEPSEIEAARGGRVTLHGRGILPGSRCFVGGMELRLATENDASALVSLPAGLEGDEALLRLEGPGGDQASAHIRLLRPDWAGELQLREGRLTAGGSLHFPLTIHGIRGFEGPVVLEALSTPPGLRVVLPRLGPGERGDIVVSADPDTPAGRHLIEIASLDGKGFSLGVEVTADAPAPRILSLSRQACAPGQDFEAFGYGFGESGSCSLAGRELEALEWGECRVRLRLPTECVSGDLVVMSGGKASPPLHFTVIEGSLSIRSERDSLEVDAGVQAELGLRILGNCAQTYLEAEAEPGIRIELDAEAVIPNASASARITAEAGLPGGEYKIVFRARCGRLRSAAEVILKLRGGLGINIEGITDGMTGRSYHARALADGATGPLAFSLASGRLPPGLTLSADGTISGMPAESGSWSFRLRAADASRKAERIAAIRIEEGGWFAEDGDGGGTRFRDEASPGDQSRLWEEPCPSDVQSMAIGGGMVWLRAPEGISALRALDGSLAYRIRGSFGWMAYAGGRLATLDARGSLASRDPLTGNPYWSQGGVRSASSDGDRILALRSGTCALISARDGSFMGEWPAAWSGPARPLWSGSLPRVLADGALWELKPSGPARLYRAGQAYKACADEEGALLVLEGGALILLDARGRAVARAELGFSPHTLCMSSNRVIAAGDDRCVCLARAGLTLAWKARLPDGLVAEEAILTRDRLFLSGPTGIAALKAADDSPIWTLAGNFRAAALSGQRLYLASAGSTLICLDGPDNPSPPDARIALEPAEPDGDSGWYRSAPSLSVAYSDRETEVASRRIILSGLESDYAGPLVLGEGRHVISAYGLDDRGLRGPSVSTSVKVDLTPPSAELSAEGRQGSGGWFLGAARVSISVADACSGPAGARASVDGSALRDIKTHLDITDPGRHSLAWEGRDAAGNISARGRAEILVDCDPPVTRIGLRRSGSFVRMDFSVSDDASGLERTEYRLCDGDIRAVEGPLVIHAEAALRLYYRSVDQAGRAEEWQERILAPVGGSGAQGLILWPELISDAEGPLALRTAIVRAGTRIRAGGPALPEPPPALVGAECLVWEGHDPGSAYSCAFWLSEPACLELAATAWPGAAEAGWDDAGPAPDYYVALADIQNRGRLRLYRREADRGERVVLGPGALGGQGGPPILLARPLGVPVLDIQNPAAGSVLHPGQLIEARASAIGLDGRAFALRYLLRAGAGPEVEVGQSFRVPYFAAEGEIRLAVEAIDSRGAIRGRAERVLSVRNLARLEAAFPEPGAEGEGGKPLGFIAYDAAGAALPASDVFWEESPDGISWSPLILTEGALSGLVPSNGNRRLRARWRECPGHDRSILIDIPPGNETASPKIEPNAGG